jgi:hypothetical protein
MRRLLVFIVAGLGLVLLIVALPAAAIAAANDVPGTPIQLGQTVSGTLDSSTKQNDVYSISLTYGQQVELTVSNAANQTENVMWLLQPGIKSIADGGSVASADTYNDNNAGQIVYTPAVSGTYYIQVQAQGHNDSYQLSTALTGVQVGGRQLSDVFGVAVGPGTYAGVLDSKTYPNAIYAVRLFRGEQAQLTISNAANQTDNVMWLLQPGIKSIADGGSVASADTYNDNNAGQIVYTPAVSGTYYIQVQAQGNNDIYSLVVGGAAACPLYPDHLWLRTSSARVRKGAHVTLSGSLNAALLNQGSPLIKGMKIVLMRSYDDKHWKRVKTIAAASGNYSIREFITRRVWFRTWLSSSGGFASAASKRVKIVLK